MEDALVLIKYAGLTAAAVSVLILVLMEDALVQYSAASSCDKTCPGLNPCFNGRCTRTQVLSTYMR